jgi:hypothetical protein
MQHTEPRSAVRDHVPYDTGKVKIGLLYDPRKPWSPTRDAYDLQSALLSRPLSHDTVFERVVAWLKSFFRSFV